VTLILSKSSDHALDDLQLADEHDSLVVSSDIRATSEDDVLTEQLNYFHWHAEIIGVNVKMLILVTIYGYILIIFWVVQFFIWKICKMLEVLKNCSKLNYYSIIPLAPKATFRYYFLFFINSISIAHLV